MNRLETDTVAQLAEFQPVLSGIIHMSQVHFAWGGRNSFSLAIERFVLATRERILLIGPSGSGKSTFLSLLCGILAPRSGRIDILGSDITRLSASARDGFRAEHFGIIFQMFNLLPYGSVINNVLLPLSFAPRRRQRASAEGPPEAEATRLLTKLGLDPQLVRGTSAANLSVGQQQRVAAARALIGAPELIVADEPTSSLDRDSQGAFLDLLFAQAKEAGSALVMVSHDVSLGPRFDRVVRLDEIATTQQEASP
jgi:putative ABC transport system ATP-binding protein